MDPGRYGLQQGWDNNSALEGYGAVHDANFRVGGSYDDRRFLDERFSRDNVYPRNAFHRDILERENYPPPPSAVGLWPQTRRRSYEEEYSLDRESRRHEKPYLDSYHEMDTFREADKYHEVDTFQEYDKFRDGYRGIDNYRDHGFDRPSRFGARDRDDHAYDDYDYRSRLSHQNREDSRERDYDYGRHSYDSDYDRGSRRDGNWRRRESRDRERDKRGLSRERDQSPPRKHERSRSRGREDRPRSRSPRGRSHGRSHREDSYDDGRHERSEKRRDREDKRQHEHYSVAPSATVVVKGLSQKTTEEDLYQILAEWGPLRHVRVIKERSSGISRGFAFIDFPSVGAARVMMDKIGDDGLVVDGRKLFFEYSKPTGGAGGPFGQENTFKSGHINHKSMTVPSDWMCIICGCVNFARRTSCFQCNEVRTDESPPADIASSNATSLGKKGSEAGPIHVLVVRGLDENADEEMLRYEFSKHAPIKDLRLVRDKFTHVSRGFAFVHFHSVEDATKALEATNGTTLEKNGQILRVAYAKSILGPGSGTTGSSQSSSLAAAAIEAATFAQQYDAVGWAPKEYNPDDKQSTGGQDRGNGDPAGQKDGSAPQSGFVWDETSGYYYDAASGFYYDGNTGLYYDGNGGTWYSYDHSTQQYVPCTDQNDTKTSGKQSESSKASDSSNSRKVVISAPAATITSNEKAASLPDAVQAAATAAMAAEKKEKEKLKEIKLASKSSILANKKKMSNVLTMWKQRSHEGQATRVALDDNQPSAAVDDRPNSIGPSPKGKFRTDVVTTKEHTAASGGFTTSTPALTVGLESQVKARPVSNSLGGTVMGVIRGSGRGVVKSDTSYLGSSGGVSTSAPAAYTAGSSSSINSDTTLTTPFRTDASALGSYTPPVAAGSGKRRFSEMPVQLASTQKEQPHTTYRDRAAERRSLYGSSSSTGDSLSDLGIGDSTRDSAFKKGSLDSMPFPPGVGGGRGMGDANGNVQSYEVITADKAIDESNVGNRMLRSMGWQEGSGLGKDGSGMVEPVQAQAMDSRAGLGSHQKKLDPGLEVQPGDSYRTLIQKKALARFQEMS
ncbi:SUPPRESSOR OF ABI3-5 isoform X2 [Vitis vinifera]|uniref:SUPPRESSOR OF ABI3-5 isoform X2 n=1 Tax=Vitis vinifera TaxID=29760 RepID=UPI0005402293|nr:SUPPRESSOR OF ABI3-5 isoform X2 [Vitis vinifera]|eukprot:XP_010663841.1 PREDICTED: SUPPRESSOR OF ABI3-5 isoform X2 [Vitis vinifera]